MTTTVNKIPSVLKAAFFVTFMLFMGIGFILVCTQIIGLIVTNPAMVTWASETLTVPAVIFASAAGIFAFVHTYVDRADVLDDE